MARLHVRFLSFIDILFSNFAPVIHVMVQLYCCLIQLFRYLFALENLKLLASHYFVISLTFAIPVSRTLRWRRFWGETTSFPLGHSPVPEHVLLLASRNCWPNYMLHLGCSQEYWDHSKWRDLLLKMYLESSSFLCGRSGRYGLIIIPDDPFGRVSAQT